jgi:CheY-like chemotaxis protein
LQDIKVNHHSILIIDDNEQIRAFPRKVLETAGYMVTDAPNGQEGLRRFRQRPPLS